MKIILFVLIFICNLSFSCEIVPMSPKIRLKERYFSVGTNVGLFVNGSDFLEIEEKIFALTKKMTMKYNGKIVATATKKMFSFGSTTEIIDCDGKLIGTIEEQILKSLLSVSSQYNLYDANHQFLANSEMSAFLSTELSVKGKNGELKAKRDLINILGDNWTITQIGDLDQRLVLFIPALKILNDNHNRKSKNKK